MDLDALKSAIELHRPVGYDKYTYATTNPEQVTQWRCKECQQPVTATGYRTWQTANR